MPPEKNYAPIPDTHDTHRPHMVKFLIDCTGMSISEAQQTYEMVKATQNLTGDAKDTLKNAIKSYVSEKIILY